MKFVSKWRFVGNRLDFLLWFGFDLIGNEGKYIPS